MNTPKNKKATCHPLRRHYAHGLCIACNRTRRFQANPVLHRRHLAKHKDRHLLKALAHLGISQETYQTVLEIQGNQCALCKGRSQKRRLDIDHDHATGKFRGLLCHLCNRGLGYFRDSALLLRLAAEYVERHNGFPVTRE